MQPPPPPPSSRKGQLALLIALWLCFGALLVAKLFDG